MLKVLTDIGFKRDFISDPAKILSDFGYDLKGDYKINICRLLVKVCLNVWK